MHIFASTLLLQNPPAYSIRGRLKERPKEEVPGFIYHPKDEPRSNPPAYSFAAPDPQRLAIMRQQKSLPARGAIPKPNSTKRLLGMDPPLVCKTAPNKEAQTSWCRGRSVVGGQRCWCMGRGGGGVTRNWRPGEGAALTTSPEHQTSGLWTLSTTSTARLVPLGGLCTVASCAPSVSALHVPHLAGGGGGCCRGHGPLFTFPPPLFGRKGTPLVKHP